MHHHVLINLSPLHAYVLFLLYKIIDTRSVVESKSRILSICWLLQLLVTTTPPRKQSVQPSFDQETSIPSSTSRETALIWIQPTSVVISPMHRYPHTKIIAAAINNGPKKKNPNILPSIPAVHQIHKFNKPGSLQRLLPPKHSVQETSQDQSCSSHYDWLISIQYIQGSWCRSRWLGWSNQHSR